MKKKSKNSQKKEKIEIENQIDQKNLMNDINEYLKVSEKEIIIDEIEKEKQNVEFKKLKINNELLIEELLKLKNSGNIGDLFNKSVSIVDIISM